MNPLAEFQRVTTPVSTHAHTSAITHCASHSCSFPRACTQIDFLGESTTGNLHLELRQGIIKDLRSAGVVNVLGMHTLDDIYTLPLESLKKSTQV